jgi:CelD/BcsL family acetyltransferase involved in cellulose biosynthesis
MATSQPFEVEWVESRERFAAMASQWDALASGGTPFDRHAWHAAWLDAFGSDARASTAVLWRGDELAAAFPAVRRGRVLEATANVHTPQFRILAADEVARAAVIDAVVGSAWTALHVDALDAGGPDLVALESACRRVGLGVVVEGRHTSPIVSVAGGWDAWWQSVRRGLKETQRRRRKLFNEHDVDVVLLDRPDELDKSLVEGFELEAAGWKGRAGTAIDSAPDTRRFYESVARGFDELGQLRLCSLRVDGRLAAFDLGLVDDRGFHLVKTAYDEELRTLSPGLVLRLLVVERCFELGIDHDFLGDDMPYKRLFSNGEREHRMLLAHRRGVEGAARWLWRRHLRPRLRDARARMDRTT